MTQYIAPQTTADATGIDITVTSPVGISCYGATGSEAVGIVMKKNSDGSYDPLTSLFDEEKQPKPVRLTGRRSALSITKLGTYKIIKYETKGTAGIDYEV